MKLLKTLIDLIVATVVSWAGEKVFGPWGMILGFIAGGLAGWWVMRRFFDA